MRPDVLVVGGGVMGVCISYWLSQQYDCKILLIDKEASVASHTTARNTGVIHRPFYLDPQFKRNFALASIRSYPLWKDLAKSNGLPWFPSGTLDVAADDADMQRLENYMAWGIENGMEADEMEILTGNETARIEPKVHCVSALHCKTDVSVDFAVFTKCLLGLASGKGIEFAGGVCVEGVHREPGGRYILELDWRGSRINLAPRLTINAAGGGALDLAHKFGLGLRYASLNFRGEYWYVDEPFASNISRNIYTLPRFPQFPFLDPHFVVRADGTKQIGPNAVMVPGPYVYSGFGLKSAWRLFTPPTRPKTKLFSNADFVRLLTSEFWSSLSKKAMSRRVQRFIPELEPSMLQRRAVFGIRTSVLDASGFVPEAITLMGTNSLHIVNYNSPGATGAPAFSAQVVSTMDEEGLLRGFRKNPNGQVAWDFEAATSPSN